MTEMEFLESLNKEQAEYYAKTLDELYEAQIKECRERDETIRRANRRAAAIAVLAAAAVAAVISARK
jgi:hypothetical protein